MKKIFTTLAAFAMVAMAANAQISVTCNGNPVENGGEVVFTNTDFHLDPGMLEAGMKYYQAEAMVDVVAESATTVDVEASAMAVQFCTADGNCFPYKNNDGKFTITKTFDQSEYGLAIHLSYFQDELPDANEWLTCKLTDEDKNEFTFTLRFNTTSGNAVEEIMVGSEKVAAIYDLQGRRVRDDFRGVSIVVYDNGKAVKRIIK